MLLGAAALAVVVLLGVQATGFLPDFRNPFAKEQTDRSQPPLLKSIQDLSRYVAAEGNFQVVVDTQNDRRNVPDFLLNERTLFVGAGSVEAYVDFAKIGEGAVVESADGKSVEIKLPAPQFGETNLDLEKSYVFAEQRGLLNRIGDLVGNDPNRQQQVYQLAEERITAAARDSGLAARAEANTRKMLEGLLRSSATSRSPSPTSPLTPPRRSARPDDRRGGRFRCGTTRQPAQGVSGPWPWQWSAARAGRVGSRPRPRGSARGGVLVGRSGGAGRFSAKAEGSARGGVLVGRSGGAGRFSAKAEGLRPGRGAPRPRTGGGG
ncbi:hypothetical protein GCM10027614_43190 [Micromonospora vulcania]